MPVSSLHLKLYLTIIGPFISSPVISTVISNYIHYKVWAEITYPFPNFNGCIVEVLKWVSKFNPHFTGYMSTSMPGLKLIHAGKSGPGHL